MLHCRTEAAHAAIPCFVAVNGLTSGDLTAAQSHTQQRCLPIAKLCRYLGVSLGQRSAQGEELNTSSFCAVLHMADLLLQSLKFLLLRDCSPDLAPEHIVGSLQHKI